MNKLYVFCSKLLIFFFITTIFLSSCVQQSTRKKLGLNDGWKFFYPETGNWYDAKIPGNIHTDLLSHNLIKDPFYGSNSDSMMWVSEEIWRYKKDFIIPNEFIERNLEIVFEGLDTYAEIYLNGIKIGESDNMYKKWAFIIEDSLKQKENSIEVIIHPSKKVNSQKLSEAGISIPDSRIFSRKAPYQYGWDWGPDFETAGIFKSVYLNSWVKLRMTNVIIEPKTITDSLAVMIANIELESENYYNGAVKITSPFNEFDTLNQKIEIFQGKNLYPIEFEVKNPQLWWCNGLGDAKLYDIKVQVSTKFRVEEQNIKTGIRNIEFCNKKDSIGQEFYFKLNGIPVFAKGANWVPAEYFNGSNSYKNYKELLELAKDANFNMLRVWGGGIYENDEFYDICDSLGIMVWQDFMFSCAMYPADDNFVKSVSDEITYQVKRLFNHPSIVLWCGNNEVKNGWFDWGWQKQYKLSSVDSLKIWNDYLTIFEKLIPDAVSEMDHMRKYVPTSPSYGWGHVESCTHGDSHYWGVWWGMKDFDVYYDKAGRFMSEYGFQAFPDISSLGKFIPKDSLYLYSKSLKTHQKHPTGFETIYEYMQIDYNIPEKFDDYVYLSQVLQAEGMQKAFDAHLMSMPYCMGTLFWQFNDCWPVVSWSAIDYYKSPKALYYIAKNTFKDIHISLNKEKTKVYVTNHKNKDISAKFILNHVDFEGEILDTDIVNIIVPKLKSVEIKFNDSIFINLKDSYQSFAHIKMQDDKSDNLIAERTFTINKVKSLLLPEANVNISHTKRKDCWEIKINSDVYIKSLYLYSENTEGRFSDNYFDITPNSTKVIYFYPKEKMEDLSINYKALNNFANFD